MGMGTAGGGCLTSVPLIRDGSLAARSRRTCGQKWPERGVLREAWSRHRRPGEEAAVASPPEGAPAAELPGGTQDHVDGPCGSNGWSPHAGLGV